MKPFLKTLAAVCAILCLAAVVIHAQSGPNGIRGTFAGDVYVSSAHNLVFGDNTTSDIYLSKSGANVLGISGDVGGAGSTANTTVSPAGPFAWGTTALSSNTATVTFKKAFTNTPVCVVTDQTTAQLVKVAPTATTAVITDTVGASDVVAYACFGNPN